MEARLPRLLVFPQVTKRLFHKRIEAITPLLNIGEDGVSHARVPEFFNMACDPWDDLVLPLRLEELADLVRQLDEAVGLHR